MKLEGTRLNVLAYILPIGSKNSPNMETVPPMEYISAILTLDMTLIVGLLSYCVFLWYFMHNPLTCA